MINDLFKTLKKENIIPEEIIENYKERVPHELIMIWKQYGLGTALDGYLKVINPSDFEEVMKEVYVRHESAIPLFATSMGDILVWEKQRYLNLLNFRKNKVDVISAGFDFFFEDLNDKSFLDEELDWNPYPEAIKRYGEPSFDECFGYVPLLGLGGAEKVENMKKVKLIEHIYLITQFMGPIE
ncbi:T6SS immunity protein Tdi1 domain-containing protein [Bacillus paralicheniformis]|uniref:T6SS immunity protein Tdi1 domain-containing protein n=1 Tax=Bacillus paralicheniformis TaxID=1648923 RepID=UPI00128BFAF2